MLQIVKNPLQISVAKLIVFSTQEEKNGLNTQMTAIGTQQSATPGYSLP
jgi:hypothetical protein